MSETEYQLILQAVNQTCEAHKEGIRAILASVDANSMVTNNELKGIKEHLAHLNGTVATLQKESDERKKVVLEFHEHVKHGNHKWVLWVKKNWYIVILLFIAAVTLIFVILDRVGLIGVYNAVKNVKDVL